MNIRNRQGEILDHAFHEAERKGVLVVIAHGLTGEKDRPLSIGLAERLQARGWPSVRLSYSGNGKSEGKFTDSTITKEVDDLHSLLDQVKGTDKIVYIGHSMGGAVGALATAKDDRINVLVSLAGMVNTKKFCEAEFGDVVPDQGCMWEDEEFPLSQEFVTDLHLIENTLMAARDVRSPWLIIHGDKDDVVLPQDSKDLFLTLRGKKKHLVLEGADHSFEGFYDQLIEEIDAWLTLHVKK